MIGSKDGIARVPKTQIAFQPRRPLPIAYSGDRQHKFRLL
jgi:hypothetical protein